MRRREFIAGLGGAAVVGPRGAWGQQPDRVRRIGVLSPIGVDNAEGQRRLSAFKLALQELGWIDGGNVRICRIRLLSVDPGQAGAIVRIITQFFCPFDRW